MASLAEKMSKEHEKLVWLSRSLFWLLTQSRQVFTTSAILGK